MEAEVFGEDGLWGMVLTGADMSLELRRGGNSKGPNAGKGLDLKEAHETGALCAGLEEEEMGLERPRQAASSQPGKL